MSVPRLTGAEGVLLWFSARSPMSRAVWHASARLIGERLAIARLIVRRADESWRHHPTRGAFCARHGRTFLRPHRRKSQIVFVRLQPARGIFRVAQYTLRAPASVSAHL
jgi:hypothetical protein